MTGGDVCAALLKEEHTSNIPVVLMSSNASDIKKAESVFKNIVKSIAKPFTPELLTSTVRLMLRSTEDSTAAASTSPSSTKAEPSVSARSTAPLEPARPPGAAGGRLSLFSGRSACFRSIGRSRRRRMRR